MIFLNRHHLINSFSALEFTFNTILTIIPKVLLILLCFLFAKSYRRNLLKKGDLYIFVYIVIVTITEILSKVFNLLGDNLFLMHPYFISVFVVLSLFFQAQFKGGKIKKLMRIACILIPSFLVIRYIMYPAMFWNFNTLEPLLCNGMLIIYLVIFLFKRMEFSKTKYLYFAPGLLVYLVSSTLLFALGDYLLEHFSRATFINLWSVNNVLYILFLVLMIVEWYKHFRKPIQERL